MWLRAIESDLIQHRRPRTAGGAHPKKKKKKHPAPDDAAARARLFAGREDGQARPQTARQILHPQKTPSAPQPELDHAWREWKAAKDRERRVAKRAARAADAAAMVEADAAVAARETEAQLMYGAWRREKARDKAAERKAAAKLEQRLRRKLARAKKKEEGASSASRTARGGSSSSSSSSAASTLALAYTATAAPPPRRLSRFWHGAGFGDALRSLCGMDWPSAGVYRVACA